MSKTVLIIGAGPVGLTLAIELSRYGVAVRIVDKAARRTDKSKALVLWSRTLELLDRAGGATPFVDAGFKVHAVNVVARDGALMGRVALDAVDSPYPYALMLPQSQTEALLEERLRSLGVAVERDVEATRLANRPDGAEAVLVRAGAAQETVAADWVLGCDGAHSLVRHAIGAGFAGETMRSDWLLADLHARGYPYPDTEASVFWHQDGAFVIFPISPGRYRVLADLPPTPGEKPPTPTLEQVQAIIDRRGPPGLAAVDPIWLAGFRINGRKVSDYRAGHVFLLGDAAHVHSPAGGQGMNTGMQDAFNLAWKLALVIRGTCGERLLDSYGPERGGVGDQVLKDAGRLTAIATVRNPVAQGLRNAVGHFMLGLAAFQEKFVDRMTEVSVGYPESPLNGPVSKGAAGPKPGERVAPVAGQRPVGSGDTPRFALFAEPGEAADGLWREFAPLLEPGPRPPLAAGAITLVRPDGYVACAARGAAEIADYLAGLR